MLYRLVQTKASIETIFHFILACEVHIVELSQKQRIATHSNHGLFQIAGLIALVRSLPWLKISESHTVAIEVMKEMLDEHFSMMDYIKSIRQSTIFYKSSFIIFTIRMVRRDSRIS